MTEERRDDETDDDETYTCPHCGGEGQIFLSGEPHMCFPCDGTGQIRPE